MNEGRYSEALARLETLPSSALVEPRADVIRAELYERVGKSAQAKTLLASAVQNRRLTASDLSVCEITRARNEWEEGATASAISRLQRAISLASDAGDLRRKCWGQVWLANIIADRSGPTAAAP